MYIAVSFNSFIRDPCIQGGVAKVVWLVSKTLLSGSYLFALHTTNSTLTLNILELSFGQLAYTHASVNIVYDRLSTTV